MDNIYQKIGKVMQEIEYLTKDDDVSTGGGGSYKAISEEKVTTAVRQSLIKNGIVIIPIKQEHKRDDEKFTKETKYKETITKEEKITRLTTVDITYRIQNIEDKEDYIDAVSSGTGVDTQDKGIGKAMTYSYKYLLLRAFAIPTGEDPDRISSDLYTEQLDKSKNIQDLTVTKETVISEEKVIPLKEEQKATNEVGEKVINAKYVSALNMSIDNNKIELTDVLKVLDKYKYGSLEEIRMKDYMPICNDLEKLCKK